MAKVIFGETILTVLERMKALSDNNVQKLLLSYSEGNISEEHLFDESERANYISMSVDVKGRVAFATKSLIERHGWSEDEALTDHTRRIRTRVSKLISRIIKEDSYSEYGITNQHIEVFTNRLKTMSMDTSAILTMSSDIRYAYLGENYEWSDDWGGDADDGGGCGSLYESCMRSSDCQDFFDIYTENDLEVLILDRGEGISGRALVWKGVLLDGKPVTFMDRIYTIDSSDEEMFKAYACERGWHYKTRQGHSYMSEITTPDGKNIKGELMYFMDSGHNFDSYPYLDTFRYSFENNEGACFLVNNTSAIPTDIDRYKCYDEIGGDYSDESLQRIRCWVLGEWFITNDDNLPSVWISYIHEHSELITDVDKYYHDKDVVSTDNGYLHINEAVMCASTRVWYSRKDKMVEVYESEDKTKLCLESKTYYSEYLKSRLFKLDVKVVMTDEGSVVIHKDMSIVDYAGVSRLKSETFTINFNGGVIIAHESNKMLMSIMSATGKRGVTINNKISKLTKEING
tara:strand:- start:4975 stop:6522 length:1548 start_codon:yes stop_codon:yes gene_type:complete